MIFAALTALLWACSATCSRQTTRMMPPLAANFWRLLIALVALGILTFLVNPDSFSGPTFGWLLLSGLIGIGIGDVALYLAFFRIGSRMTVLINFCLAVAFGAGADFLWHQERLKGIEYVAIVVILFGVAMAILTNRPSGDTRSGSYTVGIIAAIIAGFGQGIGATITLQSDKIAKLAELEIDGISQAFQRVIAGAAFALLFLLWERSRTRASKQPATNHELSSTKRSRIGWLAGAALFGPIIGISCFQQALKVTSSSGIVLAIVATTPILIMPFAFVFEGDRPRPLAILGGVIAVAGVVLLGVGGR